MDVLYIAILLAFFALISALALGCAHLQQRKAGMRPRSAAAPAAPATLLN